MTTELFVTLAGKCKKRAAKQFLFLLWHKEYDGGDQDKGKGAWSLIFHNNIFQMSLIFQHIFPAPFTPMVLDPTFKSVSDTLWHRGTLTLLCITHYPTYTKELSRVQCLLMVTHYLGDSTDSLNQTNFFIKCTLSCWNHFHVINKPLTGFIQNVQMFSLWKLHIGNFFTKQKCHNPSKYTYLKASLEKFIVHMFILQGKWAWCKYTPHSGASCSPKTVFFWGVGGNLGIKRPGEWRLWMKDVHFHNLSLYVLLWYQWNIFLSTPGKGGGASPNGTTPLITFLGTLYKIWQSSFPV